MYRDPLAGPIPVVHTDAVKLFYARNNMFSWFLIKVVSGLPKLL